MSLGSVSFRFTISKTVFCSARRQSVDPVRTCTVPNGLYLPGRAALRTGY